MNLARGVCFTLAALAAVASMTAAGTPRVISYQGRATDGTGAPVPDGSYPAQFHLYDHPTAGTARWSEIYPMVSTSGGLFTYLLGSSTPIPDSLFARYDSLYLQVIFNGIILSPRMPVASAGYALRVNTVDGASGGTIRLEDTRDTGLSVIGTGLHARTGVLTRFETQSAGDVSSVRATIINQGSGTAYGGAFLATSAGQGPARGVYGEGRSNALMYSARGIEGYAANPGGGYVYAGVFCADSLGDGDHTGVTASAFGGPGSTWTEGGSFLGSGKVGMTFGLRCGGYGESGTVVGGDFSGYCKSGSQPTYGIRSTVNADAARSGSSYAGYFDNHVPSGTNAYALYGYAYDLASSASSFGVDGLTEPSGTGSSAGGYFKSDSTGTGTSYGCRGVANARGSASAYGVTGVGSNQSSGAVYGGYFSAGSFGTGSKYGIYSTAPTSGYTGYFSGNVYVSGNFAVSGTKSAAVEVAPEQYRLVYSQESPECWFEDFGRGQLSGGRTHIELDPLFLQTVTIDENHPMNVFVQLNDPRCAGTAVICGTTGFDVVELMNGAGDASFTYRVVAKRRGYEDVRLARMTTADPGETAAQQEADRAEDQAVEQTLQEDVATHKALAESRREREREKAEPAAVGRP